MAKLGNGYMGGFSGSLGPAIGYLWNGKWCVRGKPLMVHNPRTDKQMAHRAMFKQEVQLAARLRWPVMAGLASTGRATGMTAYNLFVHLNQEAFGWADGQLTVDWARLQFSTGPVAPIALGTPVVDDRNVLTVSFDRNPLHLRTNAQDEVYLYVHCPDLEKGCLAAPVYRSEKSVSLLLPDRMAGHTLFLYAFVQDGHGRTSTTAVCRFDEAEEVSETPVEMEPEVPVDGIVGTSSPDTYATPTVQSAPKTPPADPAQLSLW